MEYRNLGKSGLKVSAIGLGTNRFGAPHVPQAVVNDMLDAALDLGINFIDSADVYTAGQSEVTLGNALKGRWDKVVLATKFFWATGDGPNDRGGSRYHMLNAVDASLRRLQSDHIDLYYLHRWDVSTPIEETLRGLDDLIRLGKIRYIGASDLASWQLAKANLLAEFRGWTAFAALQSHHHMLERDVEREVLPYCAAHGVGFVPYFPLAGGFLTGKYRRGQPAPAGSRGESSDYVKGYMTDSNYDRIEKLEAWTTEHGHGLGDLAQAWLLAQPAVCSIISGATRLDQIQANARAVDWKLSQSELEEVNLLLKG
ncbi:MAG: aldo/keto reductase [Chloroflexi bacterium HGW-Chloroflexi-6]|nr:MAG: aldo/keto reductase [Chloroflexi bacterium HGW-Chloroflexi-6]